MSTLKLFLLGPPRIELDGKAVDLDTRKATALLAYLAVTGETQTRDTLAALLWPENDQTGARAALRRTLSTLNKATSNQYLNITRESVGLSQQADIWSDVSTFQTGLAAAEKATLQKAEIVRADLVEQEKAVHLYRDHFMAGFSLRDSAAFDEWQFFQSETFRRAFAGALEKLAKGFATLGEYDTAITYARRWLALDSLLEEAHRMLMRLYAWAGERSASLRQYRDCVRILQQELGVSPLDETTKLYQDLLAHQLPPLPSSNQSATIRLRTPASQPSVANSSYPLVGRNHELDRLMTAHHDAKPDGHFVLLRGEAGIGKSRLAEEFIEEAKGRGSTVFQAVCYEHEANLAYAPFINGLNHLVNQTLMEEKLKSVQPTWLSETARLLPEIHLYVTNLPPSAPDGPGAQVRFFEGLRQSLSALLNGDAPGVLFIDDLHWADAATQELLIYLARRLAGTGMLLFVTSREDDLSNQHSLLQLKGELQRAGRLTDIGLTRLTLEHMVELVKTGLSNPSGRPESFDERLYQETEGLPFFIVEYMKMLGTQIDPASSEWEIPPGVRDLLRSRLAAVDETSGQLLSTAAVIGRSFDFHTLREASGRSELETITGLENLLQHGLIVEGKEGDQESDVVYDFTHDKLRALCYEQISQARCRLLHRRVADVLAGPQQATRDLGARLGRIAHHYRLAGEQAKAAKFHFLAGEHARSLYANIDALAHYQSALAADHPHPDALYEAIGDLYTLDADYLAAIHSYETAAALGTVNIQARLDYKLAEVRARRGEWDIAESHFQAACAVLEDSKEPGLPARIYAGWSRTVHQQNQAERAEGLAQKALSLAESCQDKHALAQSLNVLGILARSRGDLEQSAAYLERSLDIAEEEQDPAARAAALNNLAQVYADQGEIQQALGLTRTALELCVQQGDRHRQAALLNNLADLYHAAGEAEKAIDYLTQAVVIFSEIGIKAEDMQPEIWKLYEW